MADQSSTTGARADYARPDVRSIGISDIGDALKAGLDDFKAMPTHLAFLCLIYPIVTLVFARLYAGYEVLPLIFPLLAGYTLIGPLVATGMYELSRRREQDLNISRVHAFAVFRFPSFRSIATLGILQMVIYFAWLAVAQAIYRLNFGDAVPGSVGDFASQVFTTGEGWTLIFVGTWAGFLFAVVVFSLSVMSFPMLLDRNVGVIVAVQTSIRAVVANPVTMGIWGFIVAAVLFLGSLPFFVGLAVALPVLGHATWHLYRKVVAH
jgi:uncharacterized membrane protein